MPKSTIEYISVEMPSFVRAIRETLERIGEQVELLKHIGVAADDATAAASWKEEDSVLSLRASKLRGASAHALSVLLEIAVQTGRLETLTHLRTMAEVDSETRSLRE